MAISDASTVIAAQPNRAAIIDSGPGSRGWQSEPQADGTFDNGQVRASKLAERTNQLRVRDRHHMLCVEGSGREERDRHDGFESGLSDDGRMWHERHECTVGVLDRSTEDKRRSNLCRHAEVNEPDLAPARAFHSDGSR